jgi:23S rRNA U2552 (ribose-2'-O)-methylase RlmE/FtsJ
MYAAREEDSEARWTIASASIPGRSKPFCRRAGRFHARCCNGAEATLPAALKGDLARVKHLKPAASRTDSAELYVLAMGLRGRE